MKKRAPAKRSNVKRSTKSKAKPRKVKDSPLGRKAKDDVKGFAFAPIQTPSAIDVYAAPSLGLF